MVLGKKMIRPLEQASISSQILSLQKMTVGQLQKKWLDLYGEPTRSCNRQFLWRRLAWRVQELAYGGLSDRAKARLAELNCDNQTRFLPPRNWNPHVPSAQGQKVTIGASQVRGPRLLDLGTVITRQYRGQDIKVTTFEKGFDWEGQTYRSLSAVARAVTGQKWNGWLFFGLTKRKGKA